MLICLAHAYSLSEVVIRQENLSIMSCASYENTLQIYSFLSSSAQELAEICYKKLQIANFSCCRCQKVVEIFGSFEITSNLLWNLFRSFRNKKT